MIPFLFILILCVNAITRVESVFGVSIRGIFYLTILFLLYGVIKSIYFRKILLCKENIFVGIVLIFSLIIGYFNNNEFYYIKDDFFKILLIYAGILSPLLIYGNKIKIKPTIITLIVVLYSFNIINFYIRGEITFDSPNSFVSSILLLAMFLPLFFMQMVRNKIIRQSNIKYLLLLLLIFSYESLIAFTRTNIIIIIIGIFLYMEIGYNRKTFLLNMVRKTILGSMLLLGLFGLVLFLRTGIYDRIYSDNYRLFEALYVYKYYISDSFLFGDGLGKTFLIPISNHTEKALHLGFFTILLKFGLIGLLLSIALTLRPMVQFIFFSNSKEIYSTKKLILLVPSLAIWFFILVVSNGTFPEQMFGLGLAIGSYFQFTKAQDRLNYRFTDRIELIFH